MALDLIWALLAASLFAVLPGWFWSALLHARADPAERLTFSTAFSMALVPPAALILAAFFGPNVTLFVAALSALVVFLTGLAAYLTLGPAKEPDVPDRSQAPPGLAALVLLSLTLALALWASFAGTGGGPYALVTLFLAFAAGAVARVEARRASGPPAAVRSTLPGAWRGLLLGAVLAGVLARGYAGPVLYDWPYLRGGDQFNHAVMANEMLSKGNYDAYLVYPPGFPVLTAGVSRLSGLEPVQIFPVLAPALIALPALACYALARRLWGFEYGVAAAAFSGLLLNGTWANIEQARYPNLVSAQFLLVLTVAALAGLYRSPSPRSALSIALLGSSVVLYHSVGSFYAALLLALIAVSVLPYLLLRHRKAGVALLSSLALLGALSVAYTWDTYDLPRLVGGLLTGSGTGAGGEAVSIVIGTQPALGLAGLPGRVSPAVLWLGLSGLLLPPPDRRLPQRLARATMLLWAAILFAGSRTALSGFPQRFERDLGIPLAVTAAFALVAVLRAVRASGAPAARPAAVAASVLAMLFVGLGAWAGMGDAAGPPRGAILTPRIAAAGEWLEGHNEGGRILPSPSFGSVPSRGMLALGGYEGLQSYPERRVRTPRSLPPAGAQQIKDARWILLHPAKERTRRLIERYDVRYVVLSRSRPGADLPVFEQRKDLYRKVFQNDAVIIFSPSVPA